MADFANAYAAIVKADKNEDGTLTVYGKATDDSIDMDQQICDPVWLDRAMPEWFKSGGNIREQHSNIAAGVAKEYEQKSDGHYISALVVDPVSVKKVEKGVLKGFSIGIKAPRVVRDQKAANGRIIDGQIIEVSLVDRPANPNAKLIMAKSIEGESSLVQVEEFHEYKAPLPTAVFKTQKGSKMETVKQIAELAKSLTPDSVKFDKPAFDAARKAIADLIVIEAQEMAAGANEKDSIELLLDAVKHLFEWYEKEIEEGEAPMSEVIELAAKADGLDDEESTEGCDCDGCKLCKEDGGCETKLCKGHSKAATKTEETEEVDAEKSVGKCLECGCHKPEDAHGSADVSTAEIVAEKSAEADEEEEKKEEEDLEKEEEETEEEDSAEKAEGNISDVVEKAVRSAMESVRTEIESLRAEKESAVEKSVKLETELATALSKAVAGGPKRTAIAQGAQSNDYLVKAASYKAKAEATTDPVLAQGYMALYKEFSAKAGTLDENE